MFAVVLALMACVPETAPVPDPDPPVLHPAERSGASAEVSTHGASVLVRAWPVMVGEGWGVEVEVSSQTPERQVQATPAWGPLTLSGIIYEGERVSRPFTEGAVAEPMEPRPLSGTFTRTWPGPDGTPASPGQLVELSVGLLGIDAGQGFTSAQLGLVRMDVQAPLPPASEDESKAPVVPTPRLEIEPVVTTRVERPGSTWHLSALPLLVPEQGWLLRTRVDGWSTGEPLPTQGQGPTLCGLTHTLEPGPELDSLQAQPATWWLTAPAQGQPALGAAQSADLVVQLPFLEESDLAGLHAEARPSRSPVLGWGVPAPCPGS